MKIVQGYPPNIDTIKLFLPTNQNTIFCYGETIYKNFEEEIPEDIIYHEKVHETQQTSLLNPEIWWNRYLQDREFRLNEELDAYATQYNFIKKHYPNKALREALDGLGTDLSSPQYKLGLTQAQASSKIRNRAKTL